MYEIPIMIVAAAAVFLLAWAFIGWLKFREHHHILRDEHHPHYHRSHVSWNGQILPKSKRRSPAQRHRQAVR
jgi:hypothetical protein